MMSGKTIYKRLYAAALLLLVVSYVGGISLFPHSHIVDGKVVVHSHPYAAGTAERPGHNHSATAIFAISHLAHAALFVMVATAFTSFAGAVTFFSVKESFALCLSRHIDVPALRGPPHL